MKQSKPFVAILCVLLLAAPGMYSQQLNDRGPDYSDQGGHWYTGFVHDYTGRHSRPIDISNTSRADSLIRAGNMYLSLSDAIALALENSIDIEVSRYVFPLADAALLGAKGQYGTLSYDPTITSTINWGHTAQITSNAITAGGVAVNISDTRTRNIGINQGFLTGANVTMGFNNNIATTNNANINFNPNYTTGLQLQGTQPLMQGFGFGYNSTGIRIAKNNIRLSDYQFELQVDTTLNNVISTYWNLVASALAVDVAQQSLVLSQKLLDDNKKQLEIGTMAPLDVLQAQQQVSTSETNLITAQTAVEQLEVSLKNLISRNGLADASLAAVHIIPTDTIVVPSVEPIQPVQDVVAKALERRPELAQARIQVDNSKLNVAAAKNVLLPTLNIVGSVSNPGVGGPLNPIPNINPQTLLPVQRTGVNDSLIGDYSNILRQVFGVPTVNYNIGFTLSLPLRNRAAQGAWAQQELQQRQNELAVQKEVNQIRMDVQNGLIAVKNARARYQTAKVASDVAQQVLDAEQKKYELGASTSYLVVQHQTDLATARQAEVAAVAAYAQAKLQLDQATGTILDTNNIVINEAKNGHVSKPPSPIPDVAPTPAQPGRAATITPNLRAPVENR